MDADTGQVKSGWRPVSGPAPLSVNFQDQSTGSVTSWSWTFGDGGTSTAQHPTHVYATAGTYDDWHEGQDPAGITTQDPTLSARLDPIDAGRRLRNYLKVMTLEAQTIARACGHNDLRNLEPEDLCALTVEAAAMAQVPLAGTDWYPGKPGTGY